MGYGLVWTAGLLGLGLGLGLLGPVRAWVLAWRERFFLPHLPTYSLTIDASRQGLLLSDPAGGRLGPVTPESMLSVLLRPTATVDGPVAARAFLCRTGRCWPWAVWFEPILGGSFLLQEQVNKLPDLVSGGTQAAASGTAHRESASHAGPTVWELLFAVGRPAALPAQVTRTMRDPASGRWSGWQLLRARLEVVESPE